MSTTSRVYKNLNNGLWSIKQCVDGKWIVVGHCSACALNGVTPSISDKRHDWVRQGNYREVFAWLVGELCWVKDFVPYKGREVSTVDAYPHSPFRGAEIVNFHPFSEVKRGFTVTDLINNTVEDFVYARSVYVTENGVYAEW